MKTSREKKTKPEHKHPCKEERKKCNEVVDENRTKQMIKRHGKHNREDGEGMEHTAEGKGVKQVINGIDIL